MLIALIGVLRWMRVWRLTPYVLVGLGLWLAVYESGVHPTLAGVLVGLLIPARPTRPEQVRRVALYGRALIEEQSANRARLAVLAASATVSANERLQRVLHPWSAYAVVPAFGLANAGVHIDGHLLRAAGTSPVTLGIVAALVIGNMVGITAFSAVALRTGLGTMPGRVRYGHLLGGAILAGMGFTISLFVTDLAFTDPVTRDEARIGILAGSAIAAVVGAWVIRYVGERLPLCSPAGEDAPSALPPLPWLAPA